MADEPYDPKKHGDVVKPPPQATASGAAEVPYDPKQHGNVLSQPDQYGVHDVGETVSSERAKGPRGIVPFANDVVRNVAEGLTFGGADKLAAFIDSQFGKGSYDELLAKQRKETEEAGGRLGPVGTFLAQAGGGMLTGAGLARQGLTLLGKLPASASLPMKILAGSTEGGLYGAASGVGHTDTGKTEDYLRNAGEGGLLGAATGGAITGVAGVVPRVITPFPTTDPVRAKAMQTLANAGVEVSAGTKTGSPKLRMAEDVVGKLPLGGDTTAGKQMAQVTENVMKKAGIGGSGGAATPDVVEQGFNTVGGKIGAINGKYNTNIDNQVLNDAVHIEQNRLPLLTDQGQQKAAQRFLDKLTASQTMTPQEAQALRTDLRLAIQQENGPNGHKLYQGILTDIRDTLDDALTRTMQTAGNHGDVAALREARNQYAHLHILEDALGASGAAGQRGELTPSALATAVQRSVGKKNYFQGAGDLNDLARASAGYLQPPRDSFTHTREGYTNPAKWVMGAAGRIGINSSPAQKYLGNQIMPVAPSGAQMQPAVAGATAGARPGLLQPIDQLWRGILGGP